MMNRTDPGTCQTCNRPMRRIAETPAMYPGTVIRRVDGMCLGCFRKAATLDHHPDADDVAQRVFMDRAWMDQYTADRRRRHVPVEGVPMPGEPLPGTPRWERPRG